MSIKVSLAGGGASGGGGGALLHSSKLVRTRVDGTFSGGTAAITLDSVEGITPEMWMVYRPASRTFSWSSAQVESVTTTGVVLKTPTGLPTIPNNAWVFFDALGSYAPDKGLQLPTGLTSLEVYMSVSGVGYAAGVYSAVGYSFSRGIWRAGPPQACYSALSNDAYEVNDYTDTYAPVGVHLGANVALNRDYYQLRFYPEDSVLRLELVDNFSPTAIVMAYGLIVLGG